MACLRLAYIFGAVILLRSAQGKDGKCATTEICYDPKTSQMRAEWSGITLGAGAGGGQGLPGPMGPPGPPGERGPAGLGSTENVTNQVFEALADISRHSNETTCGNCVGLVARITTIENMLKTFLQPHRRPDKKPYVSPDIPPGEIDIMGWVQAPNGYEYFISGNVNYKEAQRFCEERNATLAVVGIRDKEIKKFLLTNFVQKRNSDVYIGLDDIEVEGEWYWADGVKSTVFNTDWDDDQPNDVRQSQDCAEMFKSNGLINDDDCRLDKRALCER